MKNLATFIGIIVSNIAFQVAHLSLKRPIKWNDEDGKERETHYLVFVQSVFAARCHVEPSDAEGHQVTQWAEAFNAAGLERSQYERRMLPESSFFLDMVETLGAMGIQTDAASCDQFFDKPCSCGNCTEEDIEEGKAQYTAQKRKLVDAGHLVDGDQGAKAHPENLVTASQRVKAEDLPEDPFL